MLGRVKEKTPLPVPRSRIVWSVSSLVAAAALIMAILGSLAFDWSSGRFRSYSVSGAVADGWGVQPELCVTAVYGRNVPEIAPVVERGESFRWSLKPGRYILEAHCGDLVGRGEFRVWLWDEDDIVVVAE